MTDADEQRLTGTLLAGGVEFGFRLVLLPTGRTLAGRDIVALDGAGRNDLWGVEATVTWPLFPGDGPAAAAVRKWRLAYFASPAAGAFIARLAREWAETRSALARRGTG